MWRRDALKGLCCKEMSMSVRPFHAMIAALLLLLPAAACAHRSLESTNGRPAWVPQPASPQPVSPPPAAEPPAGAPSAEAPPAGSGTSPRDVLGFAGAVQGGSRMQTFGDTESLRRCLAQSGNICTPRGAVTVAPGIRRMIMAGNVTLDGRGMVAFRCDSYCLELREGNNIVRGVDMAGPGPQRTLWPERFPDANCTDPTLPKHVSGCAVPIRTLGARQVLIEDSDFSRCGNKCIAVEGGDAITIRRNRFAESYFGILAINYVPDGPMARMTVNGNVFRSIFRRSARVGGRFMMHEFANVLTGPCPALPGGGFGASAVGEAQALVEDNVADPGSCAALQVSEHEDAKNGTVEGMGHLISRRNAGIEDKADPVAIAIPYSYSRAEANAALRETITRSAGMQRQ